MLLTIVELGYQSCWYEGHITDEDRICDKIAEILSVPDSYALLETDLNWSKTYMNLRTIWRIKNPVRWFFSFIKTDIVEDKYFEKRANFGLESDNIEDGIIKYLLVEETSGFHSFPKGHMENGETEKETAIRAL